VRLVQDTEWIFVVDDGINMFPPVPLNNEVLQSIPVPPYSYIWSGLEGWEAPEGFQKTVLDWQYIFNPEHFLTMEGHEWATFRKNARKWPERHGSLHMVPHEKVPAKDRMHLVGDWLEGKADVAYDAPTMANYLFHSHPDTQVQCLVDAKGVLWAIIAWDYNWRFINFRYCLVRPDNAFLEEYVRLSFYLLPCIQLDTRCVNDGGIVDNPGLEIFKDHMNPTKKIQTYSWVKIDK